MYKHLGYVSALKTHIPTFKKRFRHKNMLRHSQLYHKKSSFSIYFFVSVTTLQENKFFLVKNFYKPILKVLFYEHFYKLYTCSLYTFRVTENTSNAMLCLEVDTNDP